MIIEKTLIDMVDRISALISEVEESVLKTGELSKLTARQLTYIQLVKKAPLITLGYIAQSLKISRPTASVGISRLISEGYINKIKDSKDKRKILLRLSEKGIVVSEKHEQAHMIIAQAIQSSLLSSEIEDLIRLVEKIKLT